MNGLGMYILVPLFFVVGTTIELATVLAIKRMRCDRWFNTKLPQSERTFISNSRNLDEARSNMTFTPENEQNSWLYKSERNDSYKSSKRTVLSTSRTTNKVDFSAFCFFLYVTFTCTNLFYNMHLTFFAFNKCVEMSFIYWLL